MEREHYSFITGREICCERSTFKKRRVHHGFSGTWNLHLIEKGEVILSIDEQNVKLQKGDAVLIKPGPPRVFTVLNSDWRTEWCHFNIASHISAVLKWNQLSPFVYKVSLGAENHKRLKYLFRELRQICKDRQPGWYELAYCLVQSILLYGNMFSAELEEAESDNVTLKGINFQLDSNVQEMATGSGVSRTVFFTKFKETFGSTPGKYRESLKMIQARELLLKENKTASEIAAELNYSSVFYFSSRFKKYYGMPPGKYRRQFEKEIAKSPEL